jgi:uncharacterized protein
MADSVSLSVIGVLAGVAFSAGLIDAIAGGGGLITVPALLAVGLPPQVALATNKGQAAFGAISSAVSFWTKKEIDRDRALLAFVMGFLGSFLGARILLLVRPEPLKPVVLVLLMMAAGLVLYPRKKPSKDDDGKRKMPLARGGRGSESSNDSAVPARENKREWARAALVMIAFGVGFYDGFFGPGTGSILIVLFANVFGDTLTRASGNAKVVNLASNLAALLMFSIKGTVLWYIAAPMAVANALGAFVGARIAVKGGDRFVRVVVLGVVTVLVLKMAYDLVR